MTTESWRSFEVDEEDIAVVDGFSFLGALIECEGRCEKEIRRRITLGKLAMQGLQKIWKDKHTSLVSLPTKTRTVNAMIFSMILCVGVHRLFPFRLPYLGVFPFTFHLPLDLICVSSF